MHEDAISLAAAIRAGDRTPTDVVRAAIERIESRDPAINAVIHPRAERAMEEARAAVWHADAPLAGVPVLVKDTSVTQAGEPYHEGIAAAKDARHRATTTSWLIERLEAAGCVILGRTNVPELCTHGTTEPVAYGPTRNPWSLAHSAGGSSGGSGAAVAAGMVPIAHGSDGGGSVRAPASFCGLVGLKPTRGRFTPGPEFGEHWAGLSTDGFLTTTVRDTAAIFDAVAGPHPSDPCQSPVVARLLDRLDLPLPRLRIGVRTNGACGGDPAHPEVDALVRRAAAHFATAGHQVEDAAPAALDEEAAVLHQGIVVSACVAAELEQWSRRLGRTIGVDELEPRNRTSVTTGRSVTGVQFLEAREWLFAWSRRLASWFDTFDLLLTPAVAQPPVRIGELPFAPTAEDMAAMRRRLGWLLGPWNVSGQPAISVPAGTTSDGLPVGVHLVAPWGAEDLLVRAARFLELAQPWPCTAPSYES